MSGIADVRGRHPVVAGLVSGAALGVGLALLFAPRRGSETRKQLGDGAHYLVNSTSSGYRRAKGAVGHWTSSCQSMYVTTRDRVVKGAQGASRYVRDVADAVTMKSRGQSDSTLSRIPVNAPTSASSGQLGKAFS
jgi:gas vesicle protein